MSRKFRPRVPIPSFAFVVDGETEIWYLEMLKKNERGINLQITPKIPQKKRLDDQFKLVCDLAKSEYDRVFWIVDLDNIIKESNETPPGARSSLAYFSELKTNLSNAFPNVQTIVNNPCLEFWFLLHFIKTSKSYRRCSDVRRVLKVHLKGYEKNEKFFKKRDNDIYLKLKPYLPQAIENARVLGPFESEYPFKAKCEMNDLFKYTELQCCLNTDASLG